MARARSDKNKSKPSVGKEQMRAGQSDEGATNAEPAERALSKNSAQRDSLPPDAHPKKRKERQRREEPSVDVRESEKSSESMLSTMTANGHQGIEDQGIEDGSSAHRRIAEQAFILFQESGYEHGNDWSHWFDAERQIKETPM